MATLPIVRGGGNPVNLSTALAGNVVTTNIAQRSPQDRQLLGAVMRLICASGSACTYLIEGSGDNSVWYPLPWIDLGSIGAVATSQVCGTFAETSGQTRFKMIPVDTPWDYLRVTMSANTAMVNTWDVWSY